ncbi:hypothetical protein HYH03_015726 [Edaphochlamys debaryana]|uniref:U-box domain-containing protein n=1 Tax=Edaphochlamys debaryana TaxID=47281 RepID=A0A836BQM2_9CHLO|nr:hypothetical protein HYH03_015726 [Edaphochlamys debaryana]|eukprot:KAG2485561.1 hypothetical protein HYH03_015726 [Edaphochlamys debaryana]
MLFFRFSRRTLLILSVVLAVEYAIVHRISLDALQRSDAGLSQWRQLVPNCNCTDCEVQHITLINEGLYQRAYSVHLLHRVLTISSEDGDPYDAFGGADGDEDEAGENVTGRESRSGGGGSGLVPANAGDGRRSVPYAYAPGDMLSTPVPSLGSAPATSPAANVPALPSGPGTGQQHPGPGAQPTGARDSASGNAGPNGAGNGNAVPNAALSPEPGSPRLLQAVVWQHGKVLSLFPWQLRAHFFLSIASTRMYLLMGLWPRAAAVAAAAPQRLRQQPHHAYGTQPPPFDTAPDAMSGAPPSGGTKAGTAGGYPYGGAQYGADHPYAQAQAQAHAYAQQHHHTAAGHHHPYGAAYDNVGGLYGVGRPNTDESLSLAAALSALGRGVPTFLPPEMLVEHGVTEDLMASCVFKPAVRSSGAGAAAAGGGGDGGGTGSDGGASLSRWRVWPSLIGRWMSAIAGRIAHHGTRAAAKLRAGVGKAAGALPDPDHALSALADVSGGGSVRQQRLPSGSGPGAGAASGSAGSGSDSGRGSSANGGGGGGGSGTPQYALVECRLYRADRARNVSYTCPAVITVLPSPPPRRRSFFSRAAASSTNHPHTHGSEAQSGPAQPPEPSQSASPTPGSLWGRFWADLSNQSGPLLRRLWADLSYMAYGVLMPYKWAPIVAGLLSPHLFLLACLPAIRSLGLMGPFTVRLCAYHIVCLLLTGADHLLLVRLAYELWARVRGPGGPDRARRRVNWRRWLGWWRWLLVDGFLASGWAFRVIVMGIITSKQVELWHHLYGTSFQPHALLAGCLVLPASWLAACAGCSAVWRLSSGAHPSSTPLVLFQEGFLSGLSSPLYSLVYIMFAVLGLGGGGVGGGASGALGLAAAGSRLPLWLFDGIAVIPVLSVVALDVLWNMDVAARATPFLLVAVTALRRHQGGPPGAPGAVAAARRGRGGQQHSSLWMMLDQARWWARQMRNAIGEQGRVFRAARADAPADGGLVGADAAGPGPGAQAAPMGGGAALPWADVVARVARAARMAGWQDMPPRAIQGMMGAMIIHPPAGGWPPRWDPGQAMGMDRLLQWAAAEAPHARAGRGPRGGLIPLDEEEEDDELDGGLGGGGADGLMGNGVGEGEAEPWADGRAMEELFGGEGAHGEAGAGPAAGGEAGGEGEGGERLVRTASGTMRPLSALEADLRAGLASVAALRAQLAAVGRGVADLLLLGRWPPPLELPAEATAWAEGEGPDGPDGVDGVPHGFLCPITHSIMTQPALLVSPQLSEASPTYELSAIRQWLRSNRTDPTTGRYLATYHFIHNDNLRKAIEDWVHRRMARQAQHAQHALQAEAAQQAQQQGLHHRRALAGAARALSPAGRPQRGVRRVSGPAGANGPAAAVGTPVATTPANGIMRAGGAGATPSTAGTAGTAYGDGSAVRHGRLPYQPVDGPGPGQRSVAVGTSEVGLRLTSPQRSRPLSRGRAGAGMRSPTRGRSRSRGPALRSAAKGSAGAAAGGSALANGGGAAAAGEDGGWAAGGGAGPSAAGLAARQVVARAVSRQRGAGAGGQG